MFYFFLNVMHLFSWAGFKQSFHSAVFTELIYIDKKEEASILAFLCVILIGHLYYDLPHV